MTFPLPDALPRGSRILTNVGGAAYDSVKCGPNMVVKVSGTDYRMWYEGIESAAGQPTTVCYATSTDGVTWAKYGSNPVMAASVAWENLECSPNTVLRLSSSDYRMWYHGGNNTMPRQIGYATSSDGLSWTKSGSNPIVTPGTAGAWDETCVAEPKVIRVSGTDYRMWYRGWNTGIAERMGYATSADGISWTKSGSNPIFAPGSSGQWDDGNLMAFVPYMQSTNEFHAWYIANDGDAANVAMGYAYSTNGISWTRGANNPVLTNLGGSLIFSPVDNIGIYVDNNTYRIIYGDYNLNIGQRALAMTTLADQSGVMMWVKAP